MSETLARLIELAVTPTSVLPPLFAAVALQETPFGPAAPPVVVVVPLVPAVPAVPPVVPVPVVVGPVGVVPVPVVVGPVVAALTPVPPPPCWIASAPSCAEGRAPQPVTRMTAPKSATGASRCRERATKPPLATCISSHRQTPRRICSAASRIWRNALI